jgi:hypothetical protein
MTIEPWDPARVYQHGEVALVRDKEAVRTAIKYGFSDPCKHCPHYDKPDARHLPAPHGCKGCATCGTESVWVNIQQYGLMRLKGEI